MKRIQKLAWIFLPILFASTAFGQGEENNKEKDEKIEALKVGFITKELNLTSTEAEKFWPVYNEMDAKMKDCRSWIADCGSKMDPPLLLPHFSFLL